MISETIVNSKGYPENLYTEGCIRTFTGIYVNVCHPSPEMFCIEDIAHALSMMPRFGGHLPVWYSVADHCILACTMAEEHRFDVLMHDCSEAYLMDLPSPIKKQLEVYYDIEDGLMKVLSAKFGFTYPLTEQVKKYDKQMLEKEWNGIMINQELRINRHPIEAKHRFLALYESLKPVPA